MPINPKDPEDSAGYLYNWLVVNNARLIEEREYYFRPLKEDIVYQLWQLPDGEYSVREATHCDGCFRPTEMESHADSVEDFREYVRADIEYLRWLQSPAGEEELEHLLALQPERPSDL
jgi:hypothetical protein